MIRHGYALLPWVYLLLLSLITTAMSQADSARPPCIYTYDSRKELIGLFHSPNTTSGHYPANVNCRYHFRAHGGYVVQLTWYSFELEKPMPAVGSLIGQCLNDYVEVIIVDSSNVQHVQSRYCGNKLPDSVKTMQQSVDLVFQSSYTKHFAGFSGQYQFILEQDIPALPSIYPGKDPVSNGCGGVASSRDVHGGVIINPGYPETFPAEVECNWLIRVDPKKRILIKLTELNLTPGLPECKDARLDLVDGYAHYATKESQLSDTQKVQFCGEINYYKEDGQKSYITERNRLIITFKTTKRPSHEVLEKWKKEGVAVGFHLIWTEVNAGNETCDQFECRGGEYCLDEGKRICVEKTKYCIHKSLQCDGTPNCGERDNSDEENCYSWEVIIVGSSIFVFLVLIILLVICCQRNRRSKADKQQRKNHSNRNNNGQYTQAPVSDEFCGNNTAASGLKLGENHKCPPASYHSLASSSSGTSGKLLPTQSSTDRLVSDTQFSLGLRQLEESPSARYREITALPANYHPPLEQPQTYLTGANHVAPPPPRIVDNPSQHKRDPPPYRQRSLEAFDPVPPEMPILGAEDSAINASLRRRVGANLPQIHIVDDGDHPKMFESAADAPALLEPRRFTQRSSGATVTSQPVRPTPVYPAPFERDSRDAAALLNVKPTDKRKGRSPPPVELHSRPIGSVMTSSPVPMDFPLPPPPPELLSFTPPVASLSAPRPGILKPNRRESESESDGPNVRFFPPDSQPSRLKSVGTVVAPPPPKPPKLVRSSAAQLEPPMVRSSLKPSLSHTQTDSLTTAKTPKSVEFREPLDSQENVDLSRPSFKGRGDLPPPLVIPQPTGEDESNGDKSPSPWHHRVKPTPV